MSFTIKRAGVDDISKLVEWRIEAIEKIYGSDIGIAEREILKYESNQYYLREIPKEGNISGIVYDGLEKEPVGCGSICITSELPTPDNPLGKCAYIMNVYIREGFRRKGLGRAVVTWLAFLAQERGIHKIYLKATLDSNSFFDKLGFKEKNNYMHLDTMDKLFGCHCHN